jgi:glycosyltransferase involved in cell wall biosynthesis
LGAWIDAELAAQDATMMQFAPFRFTPAVDLTPKVPLAKLRGRLRGAVNRAARFVRWPLAATSPWLVSSTAHALTRLARTRRADLYIAHLEHGLAAAHWLMRSNCRVTVDMEDWYSEDLLPETRRTRPIKLLRQLERDLLCSGTGATCTSTAMSRALAEAYGCPPPDAVYNAFSWAERGRLDGEWKDRRPDGNPTIHWFSQTVGPGRGLEDLFTALKYLNRTVDVHLRGAPVRNFDVWLSAMVDPSWRSRVVVHNLVPPDQLLSRIAEHDIGFAGEMLFCRNRDLTVTNKILQYLLGGLAVVASDTAGQREVANQASSAISLYPSGNPIALADRLNALLNSRDRLQTAKAAALQAAQTVFCWERQEDVLLRRIHRALGSR